MTDVTRTESESVDVVYQETTSPAGDASVLQVEESRTGPQSITVDGLDGRLHW